MRRGIALVFAMGVLAATPASSFAADEVDWGFRHQFRSYAYQWGSVNPITVSAGATCTGTTPAKGGCAPQPNVTSNVLGWTAASATGSVLSGGNGTVNSYGRTFFRVDLHQFELTLEDPSFEIDGNNVTANARVKLDSSSPTAPSSDSRMEIGTFTLTGPAVESETTWKWQTNVGDSSQEFADSTGGLLTPGSDLDPITITIPKTFVPPARPTDPPPSRPTPSQSVSTGVVTKPLSALTAKLSGKKSKKGKRKVKLTLSRELFSGSAAQKITLRKGKRAVATGSLKGKSLSLTVKKRKGKYPRIKGSYKVEPGKGATFTATTVSVE